MPIAQAIKTRLQEPLKERWKIYARNPAPGKKDMTGRPFERIIRTTIKEQMGPFGIDVSEKEKSYTLWNNLAIRPDCLLKKNGFPDSILSMKSWFGPEQIRETFAYAYFTKNWHGQKNIRVYMIIFHPVDQKYDDLIALCNQYIDGIYSISSSPYIDDLLTELKELYSERE